MISILIPPDSAFYAVLAFFLSEDISIRSSKHSGVISLFDKEFILSGKTIDLK